MKITSPDLIAKPVKALPPASEGHDGDSIEFDLTKHGKAHTIWCRDGEHARCRYESCDCSCHDAKRANPPVRQPGTTPRPTIPVPFIALPCRNSMHIVCCTDGCECDCHDADVDHFFNPAFRHEMAR